MTGRDPDVLGPGKWDVRYLQLARLVASWSRDPSTKLGAVIVRPDKSVASVGFNGFPKGMPDGEDLYADREEKYSRVVHAEVNALVFAREPLAGFALYTWPFASCDRCCVQMLQAGVSRFVWPTPTSEALSRWGGSIARTKRYIAECGAGFLEVPRGDIPGHPWE